MTKYSVEKDNPFYPIIEDAYRVFAVPTPKSLNICTACCMPLEKQAEMLTYESRRIPKDMICEWYESAVIESSCPKDIWMFILPRILEFLAMGEEPTFMGIQLVLSRFPTGDRTLWNQDQWDVINRFQRLFLKPTSVAEQMPTQDYSLDDKLCMFALAGWKVDGLMMQIMACPRQMLVDQLYRDWGTWKPKRLRIWVTAFWNDGEANALKRWTSMELYSHLYDYAEDDSTPSLWVEKTKALMDAILKAKPRL